MLYLESLNKYALSIMGGNSTQLEAELIVK